MRTSAAGGSSGIGGINIGKTKDLAATDVLTWDGSSWTNAAPAGGGLTSVSTFTSTITGNGTPGAPLGVAYSLPAATLNFPYGSSIFHNTSGLMKTTVDNPATNYTWLFFGSASVPTSVGGITCDNMVLTPGAPTNNPGSAFNLTNLKFTAPSSGMYMMTVGGNFPGLTPSIVGCGWLGICNAFGGINTYQSLDMKSAQTGSGLYQGNTCVMYLAAGDGARVYFGQNTGSTQTVQNLTVCILGLGKV